MANKNLIIIIGVAAIIVILYIICVAAALTDTFNQIKVEKARARNEKERKYWRKEFWITCLKCVPFVHFIIKITGIDDDRE